MAEDRYPVEDGPGSGRRVELVLRVLVGTERSTVIVDDPIIGHALVHQVVPHGSEPGAAAAAVASLVRDGIAALQGDPCGMPGGLPEALGEPHE